MMIAVETIGILDVIPTVDAIIDSGWEVYTWDNVLYNDYHAQDKLAKATNVIVYYQKDYPKTPWAFSFPKA